MSQTILTTHVGSLPRPPALLEVMQARAEGKPSDDKAFAQLLSDSVKDVVARQVKIGIDIVSDGEYSKPSYATYVQERLTGFGGEFKGHPPADMLDFRAFARHQVDTGGLVPKTGGACCVGPVTPKDSKALNEDLANFRAAVDLAHPKAAFMNAASPGVVAVFQKNEFYKSDDAYIEAVAEALRPEYEAIVNAGFLLQIDSPDLGMGRHFEYYQLSDEAFVKIAERNVAALNHAVRNIPAEKIRTHLCWGNYEGPHHRDIPFAKIARAVLGANVKYFLIEGANPRHEHEWAVFKNIKLPDDKVVVPGVIDSTSNYIEHPELVAQRILRYADVVGRERVQAGTDCGFSTFRGFPTVFPDLTWKKLESLVEGARIASR